MTGVALPPEALRLPALLLMICPCSAAVMPLRRVRSGVLRVCAPASMEATIGSGVRCARTPAMGLLPCRWVVASGDGMDEHVGSKCTNLWKLSRSLGAGIRVPPAVALPFAALDYVLRMPEHSGIAAALAGDIGEADAEAALLQVGPSLACLCKSYASATARSWPHRTQPGLAKDLVLCMLCVLCVLCCDLY